MGAEGYLLKSVKKSYYNIILIIIIIIIRERDEGILRHWPSVITFSIGVNLLLHLHEKQHCFTIKI